MKYAECASGATLAERVRQAVAAASAQANAVDRDGRFPIEAVDAMRASRLLGALAPRDFGGEGLQLADIASICTALGSACASSGMIFAMHQISMANLLHCAADSVWHHEFVKRAVQEQLLFASATTEAGVGGDLRHSVCWVETKDDRFKLTKQASVISYGEQADAIFATARHDENAPSSDQVLAILCKGQYTMKRIAEWDAMGMRGTCSGGWELVADAPVEQILPKPFADIAAESMVAVSHLLWSSVWRGIAADALAKAQAFVTAEARKKPGFVPPSTRRLAETFNKLQLIEAAIADAAERCEEARAEPALSSTMGFALVMNGLKANVSTQALQIVDDSLMICGLQGYKNGTEYSLGRHLRDIHSARLMISNDRILEGSGQMLLVQRSSVGKRF